MRRPFGMLALLLAACASPGPPAVAATLARTHEAERRALDWLRAHAYAARGVAE